MKFLSTEGNLRAREDQAIDKIKRGNLPLKKLDSGRQAYAITLLVLRTHLIVYNYYCFPLDNMKGEDEADSSSYN